MVKSQHGWNAFVAPGIPTMNLFSAFRYCTALLQFRRSVPHAATYPDDVRVFEFYGDPKASKVYTRVNDTDDPKEAAKIRNCAVQSATAIYRCLGPHGSAKGTFRVLV